MEKESDDRVSLRQLDPITALRALLAVDPANPNGEDESGRQQPPAKPRDDDE